MLHLLLRLEQDESWEVRHGGLLGVMYLVGTRADLTERLLPTLLPIITKGLQVCSPPPLLLPPSCFPTCTYSHSTHNPNNQSPDRTP